jgi:hypothetical protein
MADSLVLELNNRKIVFELDLFLTLLFHMKCLKNIHLRIWPVWLYYYTTGRTKDQNLIAFGPMKCYVNEKLTGRILFSSSVKDTTFVITSR